LIKQEENKMTFEHKKRGRWKTGESGNPKGRPIGTSDVSRLRESIAEHIPNIIAELVTKAKAGDVQAARLLLERVLPPIKPIEEAVSLSLPMEEGLAAQGALVVQAIAVGKIAPGQGASLLSGLGVLARIKEIDELEVRLERIEQTISNRKKS
jgi:hypothetical protein